MFTTLVRSWKNTRLTLEGRTNVSNILAQQGHKKMCSWICALHQPFLPFLHQNLKLSPTSHFSREGKTRGLNPQSPSCATIHSLPLKDELVCNLRDLSKAPFKLIHNSFSCCINFPHTDNMSTILGLFCLQSAFTRLCTSLPTFQI